MDELVSAACSAGLVILSESEYLCWKLFKRKMSVFFVVSQLAILSSAMSTALSGLSFFISYLDKLPMFVVTPVVRFVMVVSYPMMILLRLKIICNIHPIIMCVPIMQGILWITLRYFLIQWKLTNDNYYYNIFYIVRAIATSVFTAQGIVIN